MGMIPGTFIVIEAPSFTDNKSANQQGTVPENKEPETIQDRWIHKFKSYWQKLVTAFKPLFIREYLHIRITVLASSPT